MADFLGNWGQITVEDVISREPYDSVTRLWGTKLVSYYGQENTGKTFAELLGVLFSNFEREISARCVNENVIVLLEKLRRNSIYLSDHHRDRFYHFKSFAKYFDLPVLILSSVGASASIGLQPYVPQPTISAISCFVGLVVSIITSIKLYLNISDAMTNELKMSKDFYTLSIELFKVLSLSPGDRGMNGPDFLNNKYSHYAKLVESSNLLKKKFIKDELATRHVELTEQTKKYISPFKDLEEAVSEEKL